MKHGGQRKGAGIKRDFESSFVKAHGGKRNGAGRPKGSSTKEPTKVIRVPVSKLEAIKELIKKSAVVVTILAIAL